MMLRIAVVLIATVVASFPGVASPRRPSDRRFIGAPSYDIAIRALPDAHRLEVEGTVRMSASAKPVEFFPLALHSSMHDLRVEILEPAASAGLARLEKQQQSWADVWFAYPSTPVPAGSSIKMRFSYAGGEEGGFTFSLGPEGSFAHGGNAAWYPQVDANGYIGHVGTLRFSVPPHYVVTASGEGRSSLLEMSQGTFSFDVTHPAVFAFGIGKYTIAHHVARGGPSVSAYLLAPHEGVDAYLAATARILRLLSKRFGRYPLDDFAIIEIPSAKASGFLMASSAGRIFVPGKFLDRSIDVVNIAHEIGHQWWGNLVTLEGAKGRTVFSEGLAQYAGLIALEEIEGAASSGKLRRSGVTSEAGSYAFTSCLGYDIPMQSARGYLMLAASGDDQPLTALSGDSAHALATSKGTLVYDLLARTIGRDRFEAALAEVARKHAYRSVTWDELWKTIERRAHADLRWFSEQWFERPGAPDWRVAWRQEGATLRADVTQHEPGFRAAVEVQVDGDNGQRYMRVVDVRGPRTEIALTIPFPARRVGLDPRFLTPHWTQDDRAEAAAMKLCATSPSEEDSKKAEQAYISSLEEPGLDADPILRFMLEYGLAQVLLARHDYPAAAAHLRTAISCPERPPSVLPWAYYYLALLSGQAGDEVSMRAAATDALTAERAVGVVPRLGEKLRALAVGRVPAL